MSLSVGDIFEGVYQLEDRVQEGDNRRPSRWRADDITAYRHAEVLIDVFSHSHDPNLHWYGKVEGLRKIGQSAAADCRYLVWESGKAQSLEAVVVTELNDREQQNLDELIDALPVAAHEHIVANELPEVWRGGQTGEMFAFYRKHEGEVIAFKKKEKLRQAWKNGLHQSGEYVTEPLPDVPPTVPPEKSKTTRLSLVAIGLVILLVLVLYQAVPPKRSAGQSSFQLSFERGIAEERRGSYEAALSHFKAAAAAPEDSETDARLDSLAIRYRERARRECIRYQAAGSDNLYFIPNQYYQYAAVLSRHTTSELCQ